MKKDPRNDLDSRRRDFLYRERKASQDAAGVIRRYDGHEVISFCSNDYLGLAADTRVGESMAKAITRYGVGSGSAHLINGYTDAHRHLEEELANFVGRKRALLFSTGYMANLGVITALADRHSIVFEDRLNHASMIDAGILSRARLKRYPHGDVSFLASNLDAAQHCLIATDAVFRMDGDIAPLPELAELCDSRKTTLVVDDAHGFGVFGKRGAGVCEMLGLDCEQVPVLMATLGKAVGVFGAFVAADDDLIETLIQKARTYIYTTAPPAALACAASTSLAIIRSEPQRRERLFAHIAAFKKYLDQAGIAYLNSPSPIQAVMAGSAKNALLLSDALFKEGIQVTAIRPPTVPQGSARLRITFSAAHEEEHIARLADCLDKIHRRHPALFAEHQDMPAAQSGSGELALKASPAPRTK